jgi:hypothetical protein
METGSLDPANAEPASNGNIRLIQTEGEPKGEVMTQLEAMAWEGPKYLSHFATCPNAKQHKKK